MAAVILTGCRDEHEVPVTGPSAPSRVRSVSDEPVSDLAVAARFELAVDVAGSLRPGQPISLTLRGRALYATRDGEIRLVLPEVAAAANSGWDVVDLRLDQEWQPTIRLRRSFAQGETFRERVVVTIPEPGYYYVSVSAKQHSYDALTDGPNLVSDVDGRGLWLWIDQHGGRVTEEFDSTLFPVGMRVQRGPLGAERARSRIGHLACSLYPSDGGTIVQNTCTGDSDSPPVFGDASSSVLFNIRYAEQPSGAFRPLVAAEVTWRVLAGGTTVVNSGTSTTDGSGNIPVIDCKGTGNTVDLRVHTSTRRVVVKGTDGTPMAKSQTFPCGGSTAAVPVDADPYMSHLFTNLNKTYDAHARVFNFPPDQIRAGIYTDAKTYYDSRAHEIHIDRSVNKIFGEYGVLVAAHEYGHQYQDEKLYTSPATNGLMRYYTSACPNPHPPGNKTTLQCAIAEAFADWYAAVLREADLPNWRQQLESNHYYRNCVNGLDHNGDMVTCSDDGSIVQGAIHAFLWDLTDSGTSESHDVVQESPFYVTEVLRTCQVARGSGSYNPYNGVDHLIYCMEGRRPYQVEMVSGTTMTFFNTRSSSNWPDRYSVSIAPSSYYMSIRKMWLVNLYSKRPGVGDSPAFYDRQPSDPPIEEEPVDDGSGGCDGTQLTC